LDPKDAWGYGTVANIHLIQGQLDDALKGVDEAIKIDSKKSELVSKIPELYYLRAKILWQQQDFSKCVDELDRFLCLRPLPTTEPVEEPYSIRGMALLAMEKPTEALGSFQMAKPGPTH
jgi:tetratricopeptide (TPR) repeat protein